MQTLVTTYTGTALTGRAPHVACKRFRNPDVAAIAPPLSEAPLRKILEISTKYYILPGDSVFHCQADEFCFLLRRASMSRSFHAISHPNVNRPGIDIHDQEIYLRKLSYNSRATLARAFRVPTSFRTSTVQETVIHDQEIYLRKLSYNSRATLVRAFRVPAS